MFSEEQLVQALNQGPAPIYDSATNPEAAEELPHRDLNRHDALDLLQSVFGRVLRAPAEMYDGLEIDKFHSDHVVVVDDGGAPALLESILPLRTEDSAGQERKVDLDLEATGSELQPINPLVEVEIPQQADEAIFLPEAGIQIELTSAPAERSPSIAAGSTAVYPNVAPDTDLTVAATATGVETFAHLRSPDAPLEQTFELTLPPNSSLKATDEGGAEVIRAGETILSVPPPHALDADGASVPVSLSVSGDSILLETLPSQDAKYPILVDPMYETYFWSLNKHTDGTEDWVAATSSTLFGMPTVGAYGETGLHIYSYSGAISPGSQANWNYHVPRYASDYASLGVRPTSYIKKIIFSDLRWWIEESKPFKEHPFLMMGLWDEKAGWWVSLGTRNGFEGQLFDQSYQYNLVNPNDNTNVKSGGIAMATFESQNRPRHLLIGQASVEVTDQDYPGFGKASGPSKWVNETATSAIDFTASDNGLGIYGVLAKYPKVGGGIKQTSQNVGCFGNVGSPCPRTWNGGFWNYNPKEMPQGENLVEMIGQDPIGHFSDQAGTQKYALVKVDHTAPSLSLSGSLTEQGKIGTNASQYNLKYNATDGTTPAPQSGVVSTEVKVDGTLVEPKHAPGCSTKNCAVSREWTLKANDYSSGQHSVQVTTTDGVGLSTSKSLTITTNKDITEPQLTANSIFFTAPEGWLEQESYSYSTSASDSGGHGVTSLALKIDGGLVKSTTQSCPTGGCGLSISSSIDMANYSGGAHSAELIATDATGNTTKKAWTINVSPKGEVPISEAIDTLAAVEDTSPVNAIGEAKEEELVGTAPGLGVEGVEGGILATGTQVPTVIAEAPDEGITLEVLDGDPESEEELSVDSITFAPAQTAEGATESKIVNDNAAVAANTSDHVDTIVRPLYDGAMTFQDIRDPAGADSFSWEVHLDPGQELKSIDETRAAVYFENGYLAGTISAVPAHDAVGTSVPTELSVSEGNLIMLTVAHHSASYVYPVIAGAGWQGGFMTHSVAMPPPEEEAMGGMDTYYVGSPPEPAGFGDPDDASASSIGTYIRRYGYYGCASIFNGGCPNWKHKIKGFFFFNGRKAWWKDRDPVCEHDQMFSVSIAVNYCDWIGPNHQPYGNGYHITSQTRFDVTESIQAIPQTDSYALTIRMFGSGTWRGHPTAKVCNPSRPDC